MFLYEAGGLKTKGGQPTAFVARKLSKLVVFRQAFAVEASALLLWQRDNRFENQRAHGSTLMTGPFTWIIPSPGGSRRATT